MSVFDVLCDFILSQLEAVMYVNASVHTTYEPLYSRVTYLHLMMSKYFRPNVPEQQTLITTLLRNSLLISRNLI